MWFCPVDGTLLLVDQRPGADGVIAAGHGTCFCCPVCPYVYHLTQRRTVRVRTKRKEVDDIMVSVWRPRARARSARASCGVCVSRQGGALSHARARPSPATRRAQSAEDWASGDKTEALCPNSKCGHREALYKMFQTRSADEPMTCFYKCVKCGERWKEG